MLISGAGIAGATLASLLGRDGHQVTVVERDQGVRSSGNPVDVRGNAFGVAERLGLVPRLRDIATSVRELLLVDAAGGRVASMKTRRSDERELEVPRADLCAALIETAQRDAEFRFDDILVAIRSDGDGANVTFERGPADRFDLVVGADGIHSGVRRLVFGAEEDFVQRLGMYVATVRLPIAVERDDAVFLYNEPGVATALHPATGSPVAAFMFRSRVSVDPRERERARSLMAAVYGDLGWRSRELLTGYLAADDTYFDGVSRVRVSPWSRGRVTLLGDAASSVSVFGEGSSSAISGADALARSLSATPEDVPSALARYESTHRRVTGRGQRAVPIVSHLLIPSSRAGIALRNQALRLTSRR